MIQTLTKFGDTYAFVIDETILDLLKICPDTPLEIVTDGKSLVVSPSNGTCEDIDDDKFREILDDINHRYAKVFQRLAE